LANKLQGEIRQTKPFSGVRQEALLNIRRTSGYLERWMQQLLKSYGITEQQYNVLRILRGAGPEGLRCTEIGERMLSRDPDITRLLARLQRNRLIERRRDARDRRVTHIRISPAGSALLADLDPVVEAEMTALLAHMSEEKMSALIDLLEEVRQVPLGEA